MRDFVFVSCTNEWLVWWKQNNENTHSPVTPIENGSESTNISENEHICGMCSFSEMFLSFGASLDRWRGCSVIVDVYRPQRSWGKAIFSQASVILFTDGGGGGGSALVHAGTPPPSGKANPPARKPPLARQTAPTQQGRPPTVARRPPWQGRHPCAVHAGRYGQQAGGMHPTGMQFLFCYCYWPMRDCFCPLHQWMRSLIKTKNNENTHWKWFWKYEHFWKRALPWTDILPAPPPRWPLQRMVRILLECILVTGRNEVINHA